jgi:cyclophilin family peptidyl-prolyl cis-trans isomerase
MASWHRKVFMSCVNLGMNKWIMLVFTSIVMISCQEPIERTLPPAQGSEVSQASQAVDSTSKESDIPVYPRLDNSNCEAFLLEWVKEHPANTVIIHTDFGDMEFELFENTPVHRANFLYLIHRNYFNPTEILRVIKGFVVQGGNSEEDEPQTKRFLIGDYSLPAEMNNDNLHLKGALAMSRSYENNPQKRSSAYDFYVVHGSVPGPVEIHEAQQKRKYSQQQLDLYKSKGGAIHLDTEHTVFGKMRKGFEVLDKIAQVEVDGNDWPKNRISVSMELKK